MLRLDLSGKLYKHCYNCFFCPASSCFSQRPKLRSSNFKIHVFMQNIKNKKYEKPLAPTDFVTKWHDSDWIILTARHSASSLQASPTAILLRFARSSFPFLSPSDACHAGYVIVGCCFYRVHFFLFSWQFILLMLWMSFVLKMLITSLLYNRGQKYYRNPRLAGVILMWSKWIYKLNSFNSTNSKYVLGTSICCSKSYNLKVNWCSNSSEVKTWY